VRAQIKAEYDADKAGVKAVLLVGHVPVVRSGNLNPDGHVARPLPADVFYGEMDGPWTDANGDGIYDQSLIPSDVDLEVGRVDFANLPGEWATNPYPGETDLLKRYFAKEHAYRSTAVRPALRALLGGLNDAGGQAYAANGFRNFAPLLAPKNVVVVSTDLDTPNDQKW